MMLKNFKNKSYIFSFQENLKQILSLAFCITFLFSFCFVYSFTAYALEQKIEQSEGKENYKKILRIGYQPERAFYLNSDNIDQEGYGAEYLAKIFYYFDDEYIPLYVPVTLDVGLEMLKKGELDLLPFMSYNEKRAEEFLFSRKPLTNEKPALIGLKESTHTMSSDYRELHGKKICVYEDNTFYDDFLDFLNEHKIYALFIKIPFKTIAELKKEGEFDYIFSSSLLIGHNIVSTIALESMPVYMVTSKENQELMADFDSAFEKLETDDFLFEKKLLVKYYNNFSQKKEHISEEQQEILKGREYNVGTTITKAPLSFLTEEGEIAGIFVDIVRKIAEMGQFKVNFYQLSFDSSIDEINTYDFNLLLHQTKDTAMYPKSDSFASTPFMLIKGARESTQDHYAVGTLEHFYINHDFFSNLLLTPPDEYIEFHSIKALIEAFLDGAVQDIIITRAIFNSFYTTFSKFSFTDLVFSYGAKISFSENFPKEEIKIINMLIRQMDQATIDDVFIRTIALMTQNSIFYYIKKYWYNIVFVFVVMTAIFFMIYRKAEKQKARELKLAKDLNPITGVYTFSKFLIEARKFIDNHPKADLRIFTLDIDNFSFINEFFDFEIGSKVLKQIAYHIQNRVEEFSPIANYGGDNFAVITYKNTDNINDFLNYLQLDKLQKNLDSTLSNYANLSLSFGVYDIIDRDLEVSYMLDCADIACHKSKDFFGTHALFYTEDMKEESIRQNQMLNCIKNALQNKEFELFYQPKFDINYMHVVGAEALIRWFKDGKMIPPDTFIPIAENYGLINELDYYVIDLACQFISKHKNTCLPHLSINISGFTIIRNDIVEKILDIINKYNVKPHEIDLEITETALVNNFDMAIKQILALRELGITISMDDFGTGVSSLNRLSQMPLDTIKLDRVFIMNALMNKKSSVIVRMVIELAKNIDAKTVAEGIETQEQLELLRALSCEQGQGYFYAKPMSEKNFLEYLAEKGCTL